MTEVLSQAEIDQLLRAINEGAAEPEDSKPVHNTKKIKIYDFKRPDRFTAEQIRTLSIIHETFARKSAVAIAQYIHSMVHIRVASVDQLTYEEFIRCMPTPTTMGVVETSLGKMVMEIDSAITFAMINKLFGGDGNCRERHELTDLETQVMGDIINVTLGSFKEAWKKITDISPKLLNIETNPQFVHAAPPYEMTVVITLAAKINDVEGMINICFPYPALKPILKNLNTKTQYGINKAEGSPPETNLDKVKIPITVKLGDKMLSLENAKNIVEGTIIELDKLTVEPLDVYAGDVLIGKGEAVVIDEKFGIRIVEVYSENTEKTNA